MLKDGKSKFAWTESPFPNMDFSVQECKLQPPANFMIFCNFAWGFQFQKNPHNLVRKHNSSNKTVGKCNTITAFVSPKVCAVLMEWRKDLEIKCFFFRTAYWVLKNTSSWRIFVRPKFNWLAVAHNSWIPGLIIGIHTTKWNSRCLKTTHASSASANGTFTSSSCSLSFYPVEWIEFNEIMGKSFGELVEMIQMLPILYGILGVSHWMRRHQHLKLYEFVGNSVVSYSLESGGPCRRWFVFGLDWSQVGKGNVYWNILKNCKLTWKVGSQKYFTTDIESMTEWSKCIQMSLSSTSHIGTTSLKTSCFILRNPTIASPKFQEKLLFLP